MSKTKVHPKTESETPIVIAPQNEKADDQTVLDEIKKKKGKKEQLPKGYKARLQGGTTRQIKIIKDEIGKKDGKVYEIHEKDETIIKTDALKIEGESELIHDQGDLHCGRSGSVVIQTNAPILIGKSKRLNSVTES